MGLKKLIPQKLAELRKTFSYSQEAMAKTLGVDRVVYGNIESGKRELKIDELKKLADFFQVQIDYFLTDVKDVEQYKTKIKAKDGIRISVPTLQEDKFKEVLLYILEKLSGKPSFSETVLHKILYFSDFDYYELYEEFFIGNTYIKNDFGPTSKELIKIVNSMKKSGEISVEEKIYVHGQKGRNYRPLRKADLTKINGAEKEILDNVILRLGDMSATRVSDYAHGDLPRLCTPDKKEISYSSVFYRTAQYSVRDYPEEDD